MLPDLRSVPAPALASAPHPGRLRDLAQMEGISQKFLAEKLGVNPSKVSRVIAGATSFDKELIERAMLIFGVPESFFYVDVAPQDAASVTFRKKASTRTGDDKRLVQLFSEAARFWRQTSFNSGCKETDLPPLTELGGSIEGAASEVRSMRGLDDCAPVGNVTRFLEHRGIAVIENLAPHDFIAQGHAGISRPSSWERRPLVATTTNELPGAVQRMTLAHELGHLIFDEDLPNTPTARALQERRAYAFAGAFLLPEKMMRERVNEKTTLESCIGIKAEYGVSIAAIIHRAYDMCLINKERYRSLNIQLNSRGWKAKEPVTIHREEPALLQKAFERSWESVKQASIHTGAKQELICKWIGMPQTPAENLAEVIDLAQARANRR